MTNLDIKNYQTEVVPNKTQQQQCAETELFKIAKAASGEIDPTIVTSTRKEWDEVFAVAEIYIENDGQPELISIIARKTDGSLWRGKFIIAGYLYISDQFPDTELAEIIETAVAANQENQKHP